MQIVIKILLFQWLGVVSILSISIGLVSNVAAQPSEDARRAVSLADYIAGDYSMAVAPQGGSIISEAEFTEMIDFITLIQNYAGSLGVQKGSALDSEITNLREAIELKEPVSKVEWMAGQLRRSLVEEFSVATAPEHRPDLEKGKEMYRQACAVCHGTEGIPPKDIVSRLKPPPRTFSNIETLDGLSPFKIFNTITFGIDGTPMPSFSQLSDEDRWNLAVIPFLFRPGLPHPDKSEPKISWQNAMEKSDQEILLLVSANAQPGGSSTQALSQIRNLAYTLSDNERLAGSFAKKTEQSALAGVERAIEDVNTSLGFAQRKDFKKAIDLGVNAYLDGFEKSEAVLRSVGRGDLVRATEKHFALYRKALTKEDTTYPDSYKTLLSSLQESHQVIRKAAGLSPTTAFLGSFFIISREGLEAILLVAVILSVLGTMNLSALVRWFHVSWIAALVLGIATWVVARKIVTGSVREGLEGWVSLIAAVVLVYVSFWLLAKRDARAWKQYLVKKIQKSQGIGIFSVATVTFLAVYREVFETVLFMQALQLQAKEQNLAIVLGVLAGVIALLMIAWTIFRLGKRIPLKHFFSTSGLLLYLLAVIFVGQGIYSLQEANFVRQTPTSFFTLPTFGIFPYVEGLAVQGVLVAVFLAAWIWKRAEKPISTRSPQAKRA